MLLLTWHGTLAGLRGPDHELVHVRLPLTDPDVVPLDVDVPDAGTRVPAGGIAVEHPILGSLHIEQSARGVGISLKRGRYLCAYRGTGRLAFSEPISSFWEAYLPMEASDMGALAHLLSRRWIVAATRRVLTRREVALEDGFLLRLGDMRANLSRLPTIAGLATAGRMRLELEDGVLDLVAAEPRSSALIQTETWPVRARRQAELMALAVHRQLTGMEPVQDVLERDVAFLLDNKGAASLSDLIEQYQSTEPVPFPAAPEAPEGVQTRATVALGLVCMTGHVLRLNNPDQRPLPFDWLSCTPEMVRFCIEDDFRELMDRTQFESLTGRGRIGEPEHGCAHAGFAQRFGVRRVFNHNDPTRVADYRYMEACIDRFRALLASDAPKLFVQLRDGGYADAAADFRATAELLDRVTRNAMFVHVLMEASDRRRAMPLLQISHRHGEHIQYRMSPISHFAAVHFPNPADMDFLARLLRSHTLRSANAVSRADREALGTATATFRDAKPVQAALDADPTPRALIDRANQALHEFLNCTQLPRHYTFGEFDKRAADARLSVECCLVRVAGKHARLSFNTAHFSLWGMMTRSTSLIYIMDAMFTSGAIGEHFFVAEFGDRASAPRSVSFCSPKPHACLIPDSDFITSGGYEGVREETARRRQAWSERLAVLFWRGSTTGTRVRPPPGPEEPDDFTWLPRLDACARAQRSPLRDHYDLGISNIVQIKEPHVVRRIEQSGLCRPSVQRSAFLAHKAILVIDGNSNAWSAMFCALLSGACVVKVESPAGFRQWYYHRMQPWVHFVPVSADLSDLDDAVAWMLANDEGARAIGEAGRALALTMTFQAEVEDAALRLRARAEEDVLF